jgi:hypothetical protein
MPCLILFDVAPDPAGIGLLVAVVLLMIGILALFAAGLVVFLWYRKRSLRHVEMIRRDTAQPSNPNQS